MYTYIYDEIGNVERELVNGALFKEYEYDNHGRLTNTDTWKKPKDELFKARLLVQTTDKESKTYVLGSFVVFTGQTKCGII